MTPVRAWLAALAVGLGLAALVGTPTGGGVGMVVTVGLAIALRRVTPRAVRRERARAAAALPVAVDLLAAALRAGSPTERAADAVGEALGGPIGQRLTLVARSLRVGLPSAEAWAALTDLPGGGRLANAAVRSADSGAALTRCLDRLADDLRAERVAVADAAARRVGVLVVLPLGLCFLPAFLLTGVVPVVVSVLGGVLRD